MARPSARGQANVDYRSLIFPAGLEVEAEVAIRARESKADRDHRHRLEVREFYLKQALHIIVILFIVAVAIVALIIAFQEGHSVETQKWAVSMLTSLMIAMTGYAFGKAAK